MRATTLRPTHRHSHAPRHSEHTLLHAGCPAEGGLVHRRAQRALLRMRRIQAPAGLDATPLRRAQSVVWGAKASPAHLPMGYPLQAPFANPSDTPKRSTPAADAAEALAVRRVSPTRTRTAGSRQPSFKSPQAMRSRRLLAGHARATMPTPVAAAKAGQLPPCPCPKRERRQGRTHNGTCRWTVGRRLRRKALRTIRQSRCRKQRKTSHGVTP